MPEHELKSLSRVLLDALMHHGARELFAIPGDFVLPVLCELEADGRLPIYTLSHEPGLGYAADGAARFRGGIGVAVVTYGPGALNVLNATAGAYAERSPLVIISGAPSQREVQAGLLIHHQLRSVESQINAFGELTCDRARLDDPVAAPGVIGRVLRNCVTYSQPVYLEIPRDMASAACRPFEECPAPVSLPDALTECADEILARLQAAEQPMALIGVEVRRYGVADRVEALIERLGLPVATTFMGRGLLASSKCVLGTYLGAAGDPEVARLTEGADVLLMLGALYSDTNFGTSTASLDPRAMIRISGRQVYIGHHRYDNIEIGALCDTLLERARPDRLQSMPVASRVQYPHDLPDDDAAVTPLDVARAINDLMRRHGKLPLAIDVGDCLFSAMEIEQTELAAPGYYAGMGFAVPAGIGIELATGRRPLVLVGDGAFQMTGWELGNCTRLGLHPIVIVYNNAGWEFMRVFNPGSRFNDLGVWNFKDLAEGLGGCGVLVRTRHELGAALEHAMSIQDRFVLLDVRLGPNNLSPTLARFVDTFQSRR